MFAQLRTFARAPDPDRVGVVASTLCAVHCLGTSALIGVSGVATLFEDARIEVGFTIAAMVIAAAALVRGSRRHGAWAPGAVGVAGALSLSMARFGPFEGALLETTLSVAGGALLAAAHVMNIRALRRVHACCGGR